MAIGAALIGLQAVAYLHKIMLQLEDSLMNLASINSIVPAETMIGIALILLAAAVKAIRSLSKRHFPSHLTLQTDSFDLHLQTKQLSSQQELLQLEQQGGDNHGNSHNDNGRIPTTHQRPKL
tara:strand:- start:287 stop:652 length:366 start_codon:yes stop_codon:yes gene_type:complete